MSFAIPKIFQYRTALSFALLGCRPQLELCRDRRPGRGTDFRDDRQLLSDTMCGKKHMIPGKSDADCTRECMKTKGNWSYGLVVGDKVYRLDGDKDKIAAFAGKQASVTGEATGEKIAVTSITPAK